MIKKTIKGETHVTFPTGHFISPGHREFHTVRTDVHETWFCGYLVERTQEVVEGVTALNVPYPHPMQGTYEHRMTVAPGDQFVVHDRTFMVVADEDLDFWGGMTREEWFLEIKIKNIQSLYAGERQGWWDVNEADGTPQRPAIKISIRDMQAQNKALMAHLMVDLGFFPSVGQARKNGWDRPLELGRHELGPKRKRAFVELIP